MSSKLFPTVVLCDLVIQSVENKPSLIGIYTGDILTSAMPARLRLALYAEFVPPANGQYHIEIDIKADGNKLMKGAVEIKDAVAGITAMIPLPGFELGVDGPVQLEVTASVNSARAQVILKKKIMKNPVPGPGVSSPPSGQTQPSVKI